MPANHCCGCGDPPTEANDSAAHIIPNALGGRLDPTGIVCRTCNTLLDTLADNALVEAFGDWPTLLDIPRQRGKNPPKLMQTLNGHRVRMNADGTSTRTDVRNDVEEIPEGHLVQIAGLRRHVQRFDLGSASAMRTLAVQAAGQCQIARKQARDSAMSRIFRHVCEGEMPSRSCNS